MKGKAVFAVLFLFTAVMIVRADQPFMQSARADLQTAKKELQAATPDKGGHRVKALELVNSAIAEVNAGIAYARRHDHTVKLNLDLFAGAPDQPHMERAKLALESARNNLDKAEADKGGHRAKALDLVKDAIDEVNKGIEAGKG